MRKSEEGEKTPKKNVEEGKWARGKIFFGGKGRREVDKGRGEIFGARKQISRGAG